MDYVSLNESEFLAHYGVKGMKWGVRRTPEQLGHYKKSERSARDRVLSPKTDLYRISNNPNEFNSKSKRGFTYVTTNEQDRARYRSGYEFFWDGKSDISGMVEYTMNAVKPLTIAGGKTAVESLMKAHNDPNLEDFSKRNFASEGAMRKYLEKVAPDPNGPYGYDRYSNHDFANVRNKKISDAVVKDLRAKGYDGVVDMFDRSWGTNDPTIVFDQTKNLKVKKVQKLTDML